MLDVALETIAESVGADVADPLFDAAPCDSTTTHIWLEPLPRLPVPAVPRGADGWDADAESRVFAAEAVGLVRGGDRPRHLALGCSASPDQDPGRLILPARGGRAHRPDRA